MTMRTRTSSFPSATPTRCTSRRSEAAAGGISAPRRRPDCAPPPRGGGRVLAAPAPAAGAAAAAHFCGAPLTSLRELHWQALHTALYPALPAAGLPPACLITFDPTSRGAVRRMSLPEPPGPACKASSLRRFLGQHAICRPWPCPHAPAPALWEGATSLVASSAAVLLHAFAPLHREPGLRAHGRCTPHFLAPPAAQAPSFPRGPLPFGAPQISAPPAQ
jgi:hypothetical protein